jgi:hypothetical protein
MKVIKLTETDLIQIVNKVIREQKEDPENLILALRAFVKGNLTKDGLYGMDEDIDYIQTRHPLGQTLLTIKLGDKEDFLEAINLSKDDMWFRDMIMSPYSTYEFNDVYTIEEDFKEGYIFEYALNVENRDTLKSIAKSVLPNKEINLDNEEYLIELHKILLDVFPAQIDDILSDYQREKDYEMNAVAREAIKSEFDNKLEDIGITLSDNNDEVTISIADLFSEALQLNLFNERAQKMVIEIISYKLGSNIGGWLDNSYEFRDDSKFDRESFNREVSRQFEKIIEILDEKSDTEYTIKDYLDFRNRVESKFKIRTWYETPKDKEIIFSITGFDQSSMTVMLTVKDRGNQLPKDITLKDIKMDEEQFIQFLHQPSLFKLEDMY